MANKISWPWTCTNTGDGGTDSFTMDVVQFTSMLLANQSPTLSGVIYWTDNTPLSNIANVSPFDALINNGLDQLMEPTNPSGNTVRIGGGIALVDGWLYAQDGFEDFDVSGGEANATDIIVLRRDRTTQVVRPQLVRGPAAGSAAVTQTSTTWEIKLCDVALDGSGNFSSLTDARHFCISPTAGMVKLRETVTSSTATVTFNNIQQDLTSLKIIGEARNTGTVGTAALLNMNLNNDTGANYDYVRLRWDTTAGAAVTGGLAQTTVPVVTSVPTDNAGVQADVVSTFEILIPNYSDTTSDKTFTSSANAWDDALANAPTGNTAQGHWDSTAAITRIDLDMNVDSFTDGLRITLYGIR